MDPAFWQRVQDVFARTLDLPEGDRAPFLTGACADSPALLTEVQSLLDAHLRAGPFIEPIPDRIGPYRLLGEIARGGMGVVYRASRDVGGFQHEVAVKLLTLPGTSLFHRRFLDEQQILAKLSHANIARLLDGGITPSGASYIVMELVDGVPIDRYCAGRPLPDRLRLFRTVCDAVHYAHQNLVVHRDLKPANILVTADGSPKLLDFGVAKMLEAGRPSTGATIVPAMTPDYASPEQIRGEPISTASDVYSLGILLCELVTGRRPYDLDGTSYEELHRIVCEQPIEKPGTGSPDLDAIVAKAMRKAPGDRYPSCEALSADVDRYLSKRPVDARRGARWYVFSRFLLRHRIAVATSAAVAAVVVSALAISVYESRLARRRFQDVRQLASSVVFDIHDAVARLPGSTPARKLIVDKALEHLDRLTKDAGGDPDLQLDIAEAYLRLGDVQGFQGQANLGDPIGAIASYRKARGLFAAVRAVRPNDLRMLSGYGQVTGHLALALVFARQRDEALPLAEEAVNVLKRVADGDPSDDHRRQLAVAYNGLFDISERREFAEHAVTIAEDLLTRAPGDPVQQRTVALMHKNLASRLIPRPEGDRALPHLRRAEELDAARVAASPRSSEALLDLSFDYSQNGMFYMNRVQLEPALENFRKAVEIRRRLHDLDPSDARVRDRLVYAYSRVGETSLYLKRPLESLQAYEEARRISEPLVAAEPRHPQYRLNLAGANYGIGNAESARGRRREACDSWRAASAVYEELDREGKLLRVEERDNLAELRLQLAPCGR